MRLSRHVFTSEVTVRRKAFTLVELLVVVGIIAILIAMLMPALSRVRDHSNRVKCMTNLRNIMQAVIMYSTENKSHMPFANWAGTPPGHTGWLYRDPVQARPEHAETGIVFQYVKNREIFKCPVHTEIRTRGESEHMTSYLMNGAVQDYPDGSGGLFNSTHRITKFKVHHVIIWESGETNLMSNGPPFNDGSSYPGEWLTERHGAGTRVAGGGARGTGGANFVCIDGHTEWMSHKEYEKELAKDTRNGDNRFWCAPGKPFGGRGF